MLGAEQTREVELDDRAPLLASWALKERERAGVGGWGLSLASWALNEREMADVGDVAQQVEVLGLHERERAGG